MAIKKQIFKSKSQVKVTLSIPAEMANEAQHAVVLGDFNNWTAEAGAMDRLKSGAFKTTVELEPNQEYQFRYLLDGTIWQNETEADKQVMNKFASENSVLVL